MRKKLSFKESFRVIPGNARSQAAEMTLAPGESEGGPMNRHRGADQWLYVVSGSGIATLAKKQQKLSRGVLLFIERETAHEIKNNGKSSLRTLNFYVPPAYTKSGNSLPRGRK